MICQNDANCSKIGQFVQIRFVQVRQISQRLAHSSEANCPKAWRFVLVRQVSQWLTNYPSEPYGFCRTFVLFTPLHGRRLTQSMVCNSYNSDQIKEWAKEGWIKTALLAEFHYSSLGVFGCLTYVHLDAAPIFCICLMFPNAALSLVQMTKYSCFYLIWDF